MAKKTTRKKAPARKTARKPARKVAKKAAPKTASKKIPAASKARTKSEVYGIIAEQTELPKRDVAKVFEAMGGILANDLSKRGPGVCNVGGMMKVMVQRKPATKARKGINPFTGEPTIFKAKPARNVVKVRPLKALKDMV